MCLVNNSPPTVAILTILLLYLEIIQTKKSALAKIGIGRSGLVNINLLLAIPKERQAFVKLDGMLKRQFSHLIQL